MREKVDSYTQVIPNLKVFQYLKWVSVFKLKFTQMKFKIQLINWNSHTATFKCSVITYT